MDLELIQATVGSSTYQLFKKWFLDIVMVSSDAFHIYFGIGVLIIVYVFSKKKALNYKMLIPGLLCSFGMEARDLWDIYNELGQFWPEAALHDIFSTNIIPLLLVAIFGPMLKRADALTIPRHLTTKRGL